MCISCRLGSHCGHCGCCASRRAAKGIVEVVIRQAMRKHCQGELGLADLRLSREIADALRQSGLA